jgi:hypothetical protein
MTLFLPSSTRERACGEVSGRPVSGIADLAQSFCGSGAHTERPYPFANPRSKVWVA